MSINLQSVRDLLQPCINGLDPRANITVDKIGDRLLLDGKPYFSRQEIDDNIYKKELLPRAIKILEIPDGELERRYEAREAAWRARWGSPA